MIRIVYANFETVAQTCSNQTKGRLKVFPNFQTAFYIHISVYFSNRAISSSAKSR